MIPPSTSASKAVIVGHWFCDGTTVIFRCLMVFFVFGPVLRPPFKDLGLVLIEETPGKT